MTAMPLSLAELVSRGYLAISEAERGPRPLRSLQPLTNPAHVNRRAASNPATNEEGQKILASTDLFVGQLMSVMAAGDQDPLALRKQILRSVEAYISDISSGVRR